MDKREEIESSFPVLKTQRLHLVEIEQNHLNDLFALFGDDQVTRYYNIKTFTKIENGQIYLDWFRNRFKDKLGIRWGIQIKDNPGIIGTIGFNNFTINHKANIGYDLQSAYWSRGYMSEALGKVIEFGFTRMSLNRIEAEVMIGNEVSERILSKLGFQQEGVLRDWMFWDGRYFDMIMYSLLKKDFVKI